MRKHVLIAAFVALVWAAPSNAHLITQPKCGTIECRFAAQTANLNHAQKVVQFADKRDIRNNEVTWHRKAVKWLSREHGKTRALLRWGIVPPPDIPTWFVDGIICIHGFEGAWNANTGNGYYGGVQMDESFQKAHGYQYYKRWGTANNWPVWAQIRAAWNGYRNQGGWAPWPNTSRYCGLR